MIMIGCYGALDKLQNKMSEHAIRRVVDEDSSRIIRKKNENIKI